jgi:flagellar hook protein FlgE
MSLSGALSSAISALSAQSSAIAMISDNIANSSTVGYKTTSASFESLVSNSSGSKSYASGGVNTLSSSNISTQGLLTTTTSATDMGIQGNGFFAVTTSLTGGSTEYTRNGAFSVDSSGYLTSSSGAYLLGWRTDASGNVVGNASSDNLVPIDTSIAATSGSATTASSVKGNLPADAATNATFTNSISVYDSLGTAQSIQATWTKTGTNTWSGSFANPTSSSDSTTSTGTTSGTVTVTFNSDGTLASTTPSPPVVTVAAWTDGAADSTITLNLGTVGGTNGLTQYTSGETTPAASLTSESDGLAYGKLSSVAVGDNGNVNATYSNGKTIAIYKVPVATFTAQDQLTADSNGLYKANAASGNATLQASGTGAAGKIYGSELESSTTDTNTEFSSMISAQQAYSAASQVITAVNKMFDTLISSMR